MSETLRFEPQVLWLPWPAASHRPIPELPGLYRHTDNCVSDGGTPMTPGHRFPTIEVMKRQAELTKRRPVDLCRVAGMLCRMP